MTGHSNRVLKRVIALCDASRERYFNHMVSGGLGPVMAASCFDLPVLLAASHTRTAPFWSCRGKPAF